MLDRLDGSLTYAQEDDRLQERHQQFADPHQTRYLSRIGRRFLQRYRELL
ncbi:MAG: hypothetical protein ACTSV1_05735 [Alphaproteobacteria bacterium]